MIRLRSSSVASVSAVSFSDACWASSSTGLLFEAGGLFFHQLRLPSGFLQQLLRTRIAFEDFQAHRQDRHQAVEQRLLALAEGGEGASSITASKRSLRTTGSTAMLRGGASPRLEPMRM